MKTFWSISFAIAILQMLVSCDPIDNDLAADLSQDIFTAQIKNGNLPIRTGTTILTNIPTSNTNRLLFGQADLQDLGTVTATSYFTLGLDPDESILGRSEIDPSRIVVNSAELNLNAIPIEVDQEPNGNFYVFGDGNNMRVQLSSLSEPIDTSKVYTRTESLSASENGALIRTIQLDSTGNLKYRFPNADLPVFQNLLMRLANNYSESEIYNVLNGFKLSLPAGETAGSIFGANANQKVLLTGPQGTIQDSLIVGDELSGLTVNYSIDGRSFESYFTIGDHFNQILFNPSGPLASLTPGTIIYSDQTNNKTYMGSGIGLVTIIEFPDPQTIDDLTEDFINKADLSLSVGDTASLDNFEPFLISRQYQFNNGSIDFDTTESVGAITYTDPAGFINPRTRGPNELIANLTPSGSNIQPIEITEFMSNAKNGLEKKFFILFPYEDLTRSTFRRRYSVNSISSLTLLGTDSTDLENNNGIPFLFPSSVDVLYTEIEN
jgi:hypothetical protein